MSRTAMLMNDLINHGEITIGEAREELNAMGPADAKEILGGWILARSDQGEAWKAGDPVRLPDGRMVAYSDENNWVPGRDGIWVRRPDCPIEGAWIECPAGSYGGGL